MLADIRPDVVLFACTSGSFVQGAEHERELAAELVLTALEVAYLEHAGLSVTSSAGLGIVDDLEIAAIDPYTLRALVSGDDDADVVMLSCTNVRALAELPMLRDAAGLDVVTSNLAGAEADLGVVGDEPEETLRRALQAHRLLNEHLDQLAPFAQQGVEPQPSRRPIARTPTRI